tara:strand:- start:540 stop:800 length:261 start_codon:yes stop_codon:yes gene_type:complete
MECLCFFLDSFERLLEQYRGLFEGVDGGSGEGDKGNFGARWGLFTVIEAMAQLHNISINATTELGSIEFLNWWAYMTEKADHDRVK